MRSFPRRASLIIGLAVAILAVGIYAIMASYQGTNEVPASFSEARARAGRSAQNITDLSKQVRDDLKKVQDLERTRRFRDAQAALGEIQKRSDTMKNDSLQLSNDLTTMAEAVPGIGNEEAQQLAFEAVAKDVEIMQHVVTYNESLDELASFLTARFRGMPAGQERIDQLVQQINAEVDTINGLNTEATEKLQEFDEQIRSAQ